MPFITELWDKLHNGGSLFYSWRSALGGCFWGDMLYYCSSPFNIFALIVPRSAVVTVLSVLIFIRKSFAAFNMTVFLICRKKDGNPLFAIACGILYAGCGWFAAYYYNIIWLDVFMLLPLLALSVERLIDKNRSAPYIAVLVFILFSNFYMAFFACAFAVIYFICYYFQHYNIRGSVKDGKKKLTVPFVKTRFFSALCRFVLSSLWAAAFLGVLFIPLLIQLSHNDVNTEMSSAASFFGAIAKQAASVYTGAVTNSNRFDSYANIYTGCLPILVLPLCLFNKKFTVREKIFDFAPLIFLFLSFNLDFFDYLWHAFRFPTCFPFRESFLFSFFILIPVYKCLCAIKDVPKKAYIFSAVCFGGLTLAAIFGKTDDGETKIAAPLVIFTTFILYTVQLFLVRVKTKKAISVCAAVLIFCSVFDCCFTDGKNMMKSELEHGFYADAYETVQSLTADEDSFSRAEILRKVLVNDGVYFGYNGIRQSSSLTSSEKLDFLNNMGMDSNGSNYAGFYPQTPVFNSIFGIKTLLEKNEWQTMGVSSPSAQAELGYSVKGVSSEWTAYTFDYALPLGFTASSKAAEWMPEKHRAVDNQNDFYELLSGKRPLIYMDENTEIKCTDTIALEESDAFTYSYAVEDSAVFYEPPCIELDFSAKRGGEFYLYVDMPTKGIKYIRCVIEKPDGTTETAASARNTLMLDVCAVAEGDTIRAYLYPASGEKGTVTARAFTVDVGSMSTAYSDILSNGSFAVKEFSDTYVEGEITVSGKERVFVSGIPFDKGWRVTVDGIEISEDKILKIGGSLIGFRLTEGTHDIEFRYMLPGMKAGACLSAISVLCAIAFILGKKLCPFAFFVRI